MGESLHVALDLSVSSAPGALIDAAEQALGRVNCLVDNVGVAYQTSFEELTDEEWASMWELNVMSYVRTIKAVLPGMRERGSGRIVNVSSTAGKRPSTGMPNYSVTKAAVLSLSRLVADVYAKDGILCNAVQSPVFECHLERCARERNAPRLTRGNDAPALIHPRHNDRRIAGHKPSANGVLVR